MKLKASWGGGEGSQRARRKCIAVHLCGVHLRRPIFTRRKKKKPFKLLLCWKGQSTSSNWQLCDSARIVDLLQSGSEIKNNRENQEGVQRRVIVYQYIYFHPYDLITFWRLFWLRSSSADGELWPKEGKKEDLGSLNCGSVWHHLISTLNGKHGEPSSDLFLLPNLHRHLGRTSPTNVFDFKRLPAGMMDDGCVDSTPCIQSMSTASSSSILHPIRE